MKKLFTHWKTLCQVIFFMPLMIMSINANSQDLNNYIFATSTTGSLVSDANSNAIDMSSGTTQLIGSSVNEKQSSLTNIGFDFYFMGDKYTQFSISSNGLFKLGYEIVSSYTYHIAKDNQVLFSAFVQQLATSSTGKVHYKLIGTAPNRCLVAEWKNMRIQKGSSTADGTFQLRIYETTGIIEFVYGAMAIGTGGLADDYQIGISHDDKDDQYMTVNTASATVTTTGGDTYNDYTTAAPITDLTSVADGSRRVYTFTPQSNTPTAPDPENGFTYNITSNTVDLSWIDVSDNETYFSVYKSTDNVTFEPVETQVSSNITGTGTIYSTTINNLNPSTLYYFRVSANNEASIGGNKDGNATTLSGGTITSVSSGNWSSSSTWSSGSVPTSADNVVIEDEHDVILDISNAYCYSLTINNGGNLTYKSTNGRQLSVGSNILINDGGQLYSSENNISGNLYIKGNLTVDGTTGEFDMFRHASNGVTVYFTNASNNTISGTSAICDFYKIYVDKGDDISNELDITREITLSSPTNYKERLVIYNGTLKISSDIQITPFYDSEIVCYPNGKLWIANPNASVAWVSGSTGSAYIYGDLQIDNSTFTNQGSIYIYKSATANITDATITSSRFENVDGSVEINGGTITTTNDFKNNGSLTIDDCILTIGTDFINNSNGATIFNSGTLDAGDDIKINGGNFQMSSPAIASANDYFVVEGIAQINGGTITIGTYLSTLSTGSITLDDGTITITTELKNNGSLTINGGTIQTGADFINNSNATTIFNSGTLNAGDDIMINGGNFQMSSPAIASANDHFDIGGVAQINSGTITIGTYLLTSSTGSVTFDGGTITTGSNVDVYGNLDINSGNINIGNIMYIRSNGSVTFDDGTITTGSYLEVSGHLDINSGNIDIGSFIHQKTTGYITFDGGTVTAGSNFRIYGYSEINNSAIITIGDGDDLFRIRDEGILQMNGGTMNINGRVDLTSTNGGSTFNMSGGSININPSTMMSAEDIFDVEGEANVNISNGKISFINPDPNNDGHWQNTVEIDLATTGIRDFSGATLHFGNGTNSSITNGNGGFQIRAYDDVHFKKIVIDDPSTLIPSRQTQFRHSASINFLVDDIEIISGLLDLNGCEIVVKGNILNDGEIDGSESDSHLNFKSSTAQSYGYNITPGSLTEPIDIVSFDNNSTGITLGLPLSGQTVNLTKGIIHCSATNPLIVAGTETTALNGGNSIDYVDGALCRYIPDNASSIDYFFPIGEGTDYHQVELLGVTTSGSGSGAITLDVTNGSTSGIGGTGLIDPLNADDVYWSLSTNLASVNLLSISSVRLKYDVVSPPLKLIGQSNTIHDGGIYNSIDGNIVGNTIQSEKFYVNNLTPSGNSYLTVSEIEPLQGIYTVGENCDYQNLTAINQALHDRMVSDNVTFKLQGSYDPTTEILPITFNQYNTIEGEWTVEVYPDVSVTWPIITSGDGGNGTAMINFDGIQSITFDGRSGGTGASVWTFSNTMPANSAGPVFEFSNDASYNNLKYLTIIGQPQSTTSANILFGSTTKTEGNDYNLISNCNIEAYSSTPANAIYSAGNTTSGSENNNNTITNCNISDFFATSDDCYGIYLVDGNTDWTISNNKLFQTSARTFTTANRYTGIRINNTDGNNFDVTNNIIGYNNASSTGSTTISSTAAANFVGIDIEVGTITASNILSNTIAAINFTSANTDNEDNDNGIFTGIRLRTGKANIGLLGQGNIIGSSTTTNNILIEKTASGGRFYGINAYSPEVVNIIGNQIGGITVRGASSDPTIETSIRGIFINTGGTFTVSSNTIGSETISNSIQAGEDNITTSNSYIFAIDSDCTGTATISNNIIANISAFGTGGSGELRGIFSDEGVNSILNNTVYNLYTKSGDEGNIYYSNIVGILQRAKSDGQNIIGNTVYNLANPRTDTNTHAIGIFYRNGTSGIGEVSNNFVHSFDTPSSDAEQEGIRIHDGSAIIHNNMIRLGINAAGNDNTDQIRIYGIYHSSSKDNSFYFNSVYIGGQNVTEENNRNSYAFCNKELTTDDIRNNIFVNERSNISGSSKHYAYFSAYETSNTNDYNIFKADGTGAMLMNLNGIDLNNLREIRIQSPNKNIHSGFGDPGFASAQGNSTTVDLHILGDSPTEGSGISISSVSTDIDGDNRASNTPVDIGADAQSVYNFTNDKDIFTPYFDYLSYGNTAPFAGLHPITVTITDIAPNDANSGVNPNNPPIMYYRRSGASNATYIENWSTSQYSVGTKISGTNLNGEWEFAIDGSAFTDGLQPFDIIEYYFVAQDQATTPNVWYSSFDELTPIHSSSDPSATITFPDAAAVDYFGIEGELEGHYRIGGSTPDFQSLTGANGLFQSINALTVKGDIVATIEADLTEPGIYGIGEWTEINGSDYSVTISAGGSTSRTLTCNNNKDLIKIEGADRVIFDGRLDGSGKNLTFIETNMSKNTFKLSGGATNNIIRNCVIEGSKTSISPSILGAVIMFDIAGTEAAEGNDNNIIENNIITNNIKMPRVGIYSEGEDEHPNSNNTISNNIISNFKNAGVWINNQNGDGWTISDNTMYNDYSNTNAGSKSIDINSGSGHSITGNVIGGQSNTFDNSDWQITGGSTFCGVEFSGGTTSISTIGKNIIHNIYVDAAAYCSLYPIYVSAGLVNVTENSILNINYNGRGNIRIIDFYAKPGSNISDNIISDITTDRETTSEKVFEAIRLSNTNSAVATTIDGNVIKRLNLKNTGGLNDFIGINILKGLAYVGVNSPNIIGGMDVADAINYSGNSIVSGIRIDEGYSGYRVENNLIANININKDVPFYGINLKRVGSGTATSVQNNTIHSINLNGIGNTIFNGIRLTEGVAEIGTITPNIIGTASNAITSGRTGAIDGIYVNSNANYSKINNNLITNLHGLGDINGIRIDATSNQGIEISSNKISDWTISNDIAFRGLNLSVGSSTAAEINGNIISDIIMDNNLGSNTSFTGIELVEGIAYVGTTASNTIGAITNDGVGNTNGISITSNGLGTKISNNDILAMNGKGALNGIYSSSNSNVEISGNQIYDYSIPIDLTFNGILLENGASTSVQGNTVKGISMTAGGATSVFNGINISGGNVSVGTITPNNIGIAASEISNTGIGNTNGINISTSSNGSIISNNNITNLIGGEIINGILSSSASNVLISTNNISGWTIPDDITFNALNISDGASASIQGNLINSITLSGSNSNFNGINITGGLLNVGTTSGNIIGTASNPIQNNGNATYGINIWSIATASKISNNEISSLFGSTELVGILSSAAIDYTISANEIHNWIIPANIIFSGIKLTDGSSTSVQGNLVYDVSTASTGSYFNGINISGGTANIGTSTANIIGHTSTASSITGTWEQVSGINSNSSDDVSISNNEISNIESTSTGSSVTVRGIAHSGSGNATISANNIHDVSGQSSKIGITDGEVAVQGIYCTGNSTTNIVSNTISQILSNGIWKTNVAGISEAAPNTSINTNNISNIRNTSSNSPITASGIILSAINTGIVSNNMITIGTDSENPVYHGIWIGSSDPGVTKNVYHNTVYIKGTATNSTNSYAFLRANNTTPINLRNNIFYNVRVGGSGNHYAIGNLGTASGWSSTASDYNNLYSINSANLGYWSANQTFDNWKTNLSDENSVSEPVVFIDAGNSNLHVSTVNNCDINGYGTPLSVTDDYDSETRNAIRPDLGADEFAPTSGSSDDFWTGIISSDWHTAGNWGCDVLPATVTSVLIPDVTTNDPVISNASVECAALSIAYDGKLTVNPDRALTLNGDLSISGSLVLLSDATNTASLLDNGNIDDNNTATVYRYLTGNKFHYVSSPFTGEPKSDLQIDPWGFSNPNFYYYEENTAGDWMTDAWKKTSAGDMEVGTGYALFHTGDINYPLVGDNLTTGTVTANVKNSATAVASQGWNLIGNPYPSGVDADMFIAANLAVINGALSFWDDDSSLGADYASDDYATYNPVGSGGGSHTPNGTITSGQGFFVNANVSGSVTFNNTMRVVNSGHFFRKRNGDDIQRLKISIVNEEAGYNDILVAFKDDASDGFDNMYDARKIKGNTKLALYTKLNDEDFVIQTLSTLTSNKDVEVKIGLDAGIAGDYAFSLVKLENIDDDIAVFLEDRLTDEKINLRETSKYIFNTDKGTFTDRFVLVFTSLHTWTGKVSDAWEEDENWDLGIPDYTDRAFIPSGNKPVVTSYAQCSELTIDAGSTLLVKEGSYMEIKNNIYVKSNENGSAYIIDNENISVKGNSNVENYITGNHNYYITTPVASQTPDVFNETIVNEFNGFRNDWQPLNQDESFDALSAFQAYFDETQTLNFNGSLNTGTMYANVYNVDGDGWNLTGNPYPSILDANKFIDTNSDNENNTLNGALYIWKEMESNGNKFADFTCINKTGTIGFGDTYQPDGYIESCQAFFVKAETTGVVKFSNDMRVTEIPNNTEESDNSELKIFVNNSDGIYNETLLSFSNNATNDYDNLYDAIKLKGNPDIALYSMSDYLISDENYYAIQALASFDENMIIPLGLDISKAGTYQFNLQMLQNFAIDTKVYIEDTDNNTMTELNEQSNYSFNINAGSYTNRFRLHFLEKEEIIIITDFSKNINNNINEIYIYSYREKLYINSSKEVDGIIEIYNLLGSKVMQKSAKDMTQLVLTPGLLTGAYIVKFISNKDVVAKKVYIECW